MNAEVASLVGVAVGAFIAGGFQLLVTHFSSRAERRRQRSKDALDALLSLHDGLTELSQTYRKYVDHTRSVALGEKVTPLQITVSQSYTRIAYYINLYAPDISNDFEKIREDSKIFLDHFSQFMAGAVRNVSRPEIGLDLIARMELLEKAIADFQATLGRHARSKYFGG